MRKLSPWSEEEIKALRAQLPRTTTECMAAVLRRSRNSVRFKAASLGIPHLDPKRHWSEEELVALQHAWPESSARYLLSNFPGKSWNAIKKKARQLDLGPRLRGYLTIPQASEIVGVDPPLLWKIIRSEGVQYMNRTPGKRKIPCVEEENIRLAADRYFKAQGRLETLSQACARLGVYWQTLWRAHKYYRPWTRGSKVLRETPARWDELLRLHRERMRERRLRATKKGLQVAHAAARQRKHEAGSVATAPSASRTARSSQRKHSVSSSGASSGSHKTPDTSSTPGCAKTDSAPTSTKRKKSA